MTPCFPSPADTFVRQRSVFWTRPPMNNGSAASRRVGVVTAKPWGTNQSSVAVEGTTVTAFARGLDHPRWLYTLPNGDVLIAETNARHRPDDARGIGGWFFKRYQKKAGGASPMPWCASRMLLGRLISVRLRSRSSTCRVARAITTRRKTSSRRQTGGGSTSRWARIATRPRTVSSGSGNARRSGRWTPPRASIASMRRGCATLWGWRGNLPAALWVAVNERDELEGDLVPDYMTAVREGAFYGWPYSYFGQYVDTRVTPP